MLWQVLRTELGVSDSKLDNLVGCVLDCHNANLLTYCQVLHAPKFFTLRFLTVESLCV